MEEIEIKQDLSFRIIQKCLTVDELVNGTEPDYFNSETTEGYQRKIVKKHCDRIIDYIMNNPFFFPSPVICSTRENPNGKLWVVDGQHRIEAFRIIKESNPEKYEAIKQNTLPVIELIKPDLKTEIQTFIAINKKGRKVDTSLAFVLQNKPRGEHDFETSKKARINYLIAGLAITINDNDDDLFSKYEETIWENEITYEDNPKREGKLISISAFARAEYPLINKLMACGVIPIEWENTDEKNKEVEDLILKLFMFKWSLIKHKWSQLFTLDKTSRAIIQGPIGCASLNKFIIRAILNGNKVKSEKEYLENLEYIFSILNVDSINWLKGEKYSSYSSEAGYSIIAEDLCNNLF